MNDLPASPPPVAPATVMGKKKVFVSGCFDMLHSGHVRFLEEAAGYGEVYVGLGSDRTVAALKGRSPVNTQEERKYLIESLRHVKKCFVNTGTGIMDFVEQLKRVSPDVFVVNEEGNTPAKEDYCRSRGIEYIVLKRNPRGNLPARSTTSLRKECRIPYRLDLAGGWLDQPFVSRHGAGPVLTICVEPTLEFNERSGMASSSRRRAIELWQTDVPQGNKEQLARILFSYENPPGVKYFSGSQDAIGIVFPGLNRLDYNGSYWPEKIASVDDERTLRWLEDHLCLVTIRPRKTDFQVCKETRITPSRVRRLASAAGQCWDAIRKKDLQGFGCSLKNSFEAQVSLFPGMMNRDVRTAIKHYAGKALGWKLSGAGGGGYLVLVSQHKIAGSIRIKIRRNSL